jgi:hypothetical protein
MIVFLDECIYIYIVISTIYTSVHKYMQVYTRGTQEYTGIRQGYTGIHRHTQVYAGIHRYTQAYTGIRRHTPGVHRYMHKGYTGYTGIH